MRSPEPPWPIPVTPLEPAPGDSTPGANADWPRAFARRWLAGCVDRNLLTYDDLLVRLRDTLADPERGEEACRLLRDRYRVVLVDEFQDTDPVQWEVVRRAFGDGAGHPGAHRRSEAGHLRLPRRGRLRLPGRSRAGG